MSPYEGPLTLIEETAHGSCRSTTAPEEAAYVSPSVFTCACLCEGETCWAVNQSQPVLGHSRQCWVFCFLCCWWDGGGGGVVIGSHHSAFSRWFPAGLRMTCDNITVLKGQAWREPVGGLCQSQSVYSSSICTHSTVQHICDLFLGKGAFMNFQTPSI